MQIITREYTLSDKYLGMDIQNHPQDGGGQRYR